MNKKDRYICYSDFYCTICGEKITLPRQQSSQREKFHIKDIYCIRCKNSTKHLEVRQKDFAFDILKQYKEKMLEEVCEV